MTTQVQYEIKGDIYECSLILGDGECIRIPMRKDGYIFATALCVAAKKKINDWLRLNETKHLIKKLETYLLKSDTGTPYHNGTPRSVVEIYKGNSNKYEQGTWVHPDLGIDLAQWCSRSFSVQVSKWIRELLITGVVTLGAEKKESELEERYQKIIDDLELRLKEKDEVLEKTAEQLKLTEEMSILQEKELKQVINQHNKLYNNHQSYLKRKELYKVKDGDCVYLCDMNGLRKHSEFDEIKVGSTNNVNQRMSDFRTASPYNKLLFVMYTPNHLILEQAMKKKYEESLSLNNREFISESLETLKKSMIEIANLLSLKYVILDEDEIDNFNENIIPMAIENREVEIPEGTQRCGGRFHETEESRILTFDKYFANKSEKNGINRLCKECYLTGVYGDKRKRRKVVAIPTFNPMIEKWCNLCETVKKHSEFYNASSTKDGLNPNCRSCKSAQKKKYVEKKKATERL